MRSQPLTLGARYVFPVEGPPIAEGRVTIQQGRIAHVGPAEERAADFDLGNVAITPGFVNAHTHLELPPLTGRASENSLQMDQISWLRSVIEHRRTESPDSQAATIARNLEESLRAGTTLLADTTTAGKSWEALATAPIRAVVFAEILGLKRSRGLETNQAAWDWIAQIPPEDQMRAHTRPGLSPHAPYSTAGWLYHRAASTKLPLSTHLAELPEELELLAHRRGRLREFLEALGAWDDDWEPISPHPADYIRKGELREADWIVAHGTYLDPDDFWQLRPEAAPEGSRVAVAYCPRTHARFGHKPHPFREMLERGVVVCVGTDSLASNSSLSVLEELRFLRRRDDSLPGALLLTMGTLFGAWALKADSITGSLQAGKSADLAVIPLPDLDAEDPHTLLFEADHDVRATAFEGAFVNGPDDLVGLS